VFASDAWFELVAHAAREAERLGLRIGMHHCDGWGTTGGPWITPADAMKEVVYSALRLAPGTRPAAPLARPPIQQGFYRDIAVLAHPARRPTRAPLMIAGTTMVLGGKTVTQLTDGNLRSEQLWRAAGGKLPPCTLTLAAPATVAGLAVVPGALALQLRDTFGTLAIEVQVGGAWQAAGEAPLRARPQVITLPAIAPISALRLRVDGYAGGDLGQIRQGFPIAELELLAPGEVSAVMPLIPDIQAQASVELRQRPVVSTPAVAPALIVPRDAVLDLTSHLRSDGTLDWTAPATGGDWVVLRFGYTVIGHQNGPATKAGKGLECDKLDPRGIDAHWNGFVAPLLDRLGPLAGRGFSYLLMDSWEAQTQNWTDAMPARFRARNGYDLTPFLPVLAGEVVDSVAESERALQDWRRTIAALIAEHYYGRFADHCRSRGITLLAEAAGSQAALADPIANAARLDVPMTEFWVPHVPRRSHATSSSAANRTWSRRRICMAGRSSPPKRSPRAAAPGCTILRS